MRFSLTLARGGFGAVLLAAPALAADNEAGVPLSPVEAAGAWTIEASGRSLCSLTLGADHSVKAPGDCGGTFATAPTSWQPTADGMALMGPDGQQVLGFGRWSNSLFVSHRSSGEDVQLRRGARGAP